MMGELAKPFIFWVIEDPLTLALSQQARLGELAIESGHIRLRIWLGEGAGCGPLHKVERNSGVPSPPPYPLVDMAALRGNLAKARLREKDGMRGVLGRARPDLV
jgi:hypothetical protein